MKKTTSNEVQVLGRILYLLEERSVSSLAEKDQQFGNFIEELYARISDKAMRLTYNSK